MSRAYTATQFVDLARVFGLPGGSPSQALVVLLLADIHPASVNLTTIAKWLRRSTASVTGLMDGLEAGGWVERLHQPEDRRQIKAQLTERSLLAIARVTNGGASQP